MCHVELSSAAASDWEIWGFPTVTQVNSVAELSFVSNCPRMAVARSSSHPAEAPFSHAWSIAILSSRGALSHCEVVRRRLPLLDSSGIPGWSHGFFAVLPKQPRQEPCKLLRDYEKRKKREYLERIRNVGHGDFTPLVVATSIGPEGSMTLKRLAWRLEKKEMHISLVRVPTLHP